MVNMSGLVGLTEIAGLHYLVSAVIAVELSLWFTFAFNELWTWNDRRAGWIGMRLFKYHLVNGAGVGINIGMLFALVAGIGLYYPIANFFGAAAAAVWNFIANHLFTWAADPQPPRALQS